MALSLRSAPGTYDRNDQSALRSAIEGEDKFNAKTNAANVFNQDQIVRGALEVISTTGAFMPPSMTSAQRDALTARNGMIIYNTTLGKFQGREAGAWVNLI